MPDIPVGVHTLPVENIAVHGFRGPGLRIFHLEHTTGIDDVESRINSRDLFKWTGADRTQDQHFQWVHAFVPQYDIIVLCYHIAPAGVSACARTW